MKAWRSWPSKTADGDLRRRTMLEPSLDSGHLNAEAVDGSHEQAQASASPAPVSYRRNRKFRDSVVSLSAVNDRSSSLDFGLSTREAPVSQEKKPRLQPFNLTRSRHASDSQLSKTAREQATPPLPSVTTPTIIKTAPTQDIFEKKKRKAFFTLPRRTEPPLLNQKKSQQGLNANKPGANPEVSTKVTFDEPPRDRPNASTAPPPYGDESSSSLAIPVSRVSESSRSDESSADHGLYATTTTTHTVSTTTTVFRLPRRKKDKGPLFPLPPKTNSGSSSANMTPRLSTSERPSDSPSPLVPSNLGKQELRNAPRKSGQHSPTRTGIVSPRLPRSPSPPLSASIRSSSATGRGSVLDKVRTATLTSQRRHPELDNLPTPPLTQSNRTSTSTTGRPSLGGLINLSRLRQSSEPMFPRNGSGSGAPGTPRSVDSKNNSFNLSREPAVVIPERQDGDTPAKYLSRLEEVVNRSALVALLSKSDDDFMRNVLRSYMRRFKFYEDPLDMAIRKLLMHVELPKETQQIDRTLQSFADRYHECNPGIFASPDDAYFVAFSVLILHTDIFNKSNKHKMQKQDYVKNTKEQGGVTSEILECFYDNIAYTPFIHVEDDLDVAGGKVVTEKQSRKQGLKAPGTPLKRASNKPVDPYTIILDSNLESLRPQFREMLISEDPFNYLGTTKTLNYTTLSRNFFKYGVVQILSSRSRPEAFRHQATTLNPSEASMGVVDMRVAKVGMLWRKDAKKKKARSPWQEWGAILTGSQLYFFRNTAWVKSMLHQRNAQASGPCVFKPPIEHFKPDFFLSMDSVVALVDSQYKKHKHAFLLTGQNAFQEVLLADNESEMNDWLAKLNYASVFRTAGVRMRGVVLDYHQPQDRDEPPDSPTSTKPTSNTAAEESPKQRGRNDELTQQIMSARRQIMSQKLSEADEKLISLDKTLDVQLRTARHLCVLAPIQERTREELALAATTLAANIRWTQVERWRVKCYRDMLCLDLEQDIKPRLKDVTEQMQPSEMSPASNKDQQSRSPFSRLNSKAGRSSSRSRPSNSPAGVNRLWSMDDIFKAPKQRPSVSSPQNAWELPPLSFDQKRSASLTRESNRTGSDAIEELAHTTTVTSQAIVEESNASTVATTEAIGTDEDEQQVLLDAGIVSTSANSPSGDKKAGMLQEVLAEQDKDKPQSTEADDVDGLQKVRHSIHKKLQSAAHVPTHHARNKKIRDSTSSGGTAGGSTGATGGGDDNASNAESEGGLSRSAGSFTVHGKKASVIKFGSEWQSLSQDERVRLLRTVPQHQRDSSAERAAAAADTEDGSSVTAADDNPLASLASRFQPRPRTATTTSTATVQTIGVSASIEDGQTPADPLQSHFENEEDNPSTAEVADTESAGNDSER